MTIAQILSTVCERRGLHGDAYALKHRSKALEPSLTVRFSGLVANATLELAEVSTAKAAGGSCNIALQLEGGGRKTAKLQTSTTLLQVVEHLSPESLLVDGVLSIVLTRPIVGLDALRSTTLRELGVTAGSSALLRLRTEEANAADGATPALAPTQVAEPPQKQPAVSSSGVVDVADAAHMHAMGQPLQPQPQPPPQPQPQAQLQVLAQAHHAQPEPSVVAESGAGATADALAAEDAQLAVLREMLTEAMLLLRESLGGPSPSRNESMAAGGGLLEYIESVSLLRRYLRNIASSPSEPKFRLIRAGNAAFAARVGRHAAARQLLRLVGFKDELWAAVGFDGATERMWR
eukprot:CAMPEP_0183344986 /NCGR_PEP_ID=MMETSP0164_2-20130417/10534_1 /TAXON_ID=221442 /ORGANISM="Coccolithus pelagicus ssp braarudi, Strain PLY182g" /LENGTH=347 /DNA_ID=CAMNT_0025516073 /DNA_START=85 /DNA_END=1125 /DNA_ORIENTATION=-